MKKYDIYRADFDPPKGSVQAGIRPCVIVQSNRFNIHSPTFLVVPITSNDSKIFPSEFLIHPSRENGLTQTSRFLGSQVTALDQSFIGERLGSLEPNYYPQVQQAIDIAMDAEGLF